MGALRTGFVLSIFSMFITESVAQDAATLERMARASVDALLGTTSVVAQPNFKDGQLNACSLIYSALARDWTYKQGGYIKVDGNFALWGVKGQPGVTLKVVLHDIDPRSMSFTPSPPTSAYFVSGAKTTKSAVLSQYPSDTGRNIRGV